MKCPKCGSEMEIAFNTIDTNGKQGKPFYICKTYECSYSYSANSYYDLVKIKEKYQARLDKVLNKFEWENNVCAQYRKNNSSLLEINYVYPNFYINREVLSLETVESLLEDLEKE